MKASLNSCSGVMARPSLRAYGIVLVPVFVLEIAPASARVVASHTVTPASRQKSSDFDLASGASILALVLAMWLRMKL
jgi:hypothetical protein